MVAIPAICAYWFLQGKIEKFASRAETTHRDAENAIRRNGKSSKKPTTGKRDKALSA